MSEKFPMPPSPESFEEEEFVHTPLIELLPNIDKEGLKQDGDFLSLGAQAKENTARASESGQMHHAAALETPFAVHLRREIEEIERTDPETYERIKNIVSGNTLIDLAAGENIHGYEIARSLGGKAYVGIEPYNAARLSDTILYKMSKERDREKEKIPYTVVAEDALTFLRRLPDNMEGIAMLSSGTDANVFKDTGYNQSVAAEIGRVLGSGEGVILYDSVFAEGLNQESMEVSEAGKLFRLVYALKKG